MIVLKYDTLDNPFFWIFSFRSHDSHVQAFSDTYVRRDYRCMLYA